MIEQEQIDKIKSTVAEFFNKMTLPASNVEVEPATEKEPRENQEAVEMRDVVSINIESNEPQILIGQGGQTLFEIQRLLRMALNKKLQKVFYVNLDINGYKKKKVDYLKDLAKSAADYVASTNQEKALPPMSSYERRVVHAELSQRTDVSTESQGSSFDRHIIIKPK